MQNQLSKSPFGFDIEKDKNERISLTDLWKASGSNPQNTPAKWQETETAKAFIEATGQILNVAKNDIIKSKRGKGGGTFAHKQIALAYAKYLSPELHVLVNQTFFERIEEENNPELAIERAHRSWKKKGKSDEWIEKRSIGIAARKHFTGVLSNHGVKSRGFANCTDAIYKPLYGGGSDVVRLKHGLTKKLSTRESMTTTELMATMLAEQLASEKIEKNNIRGNKECEAECLKSSRSIAQAIIQSRL